ncbi:MAG: hypothetical protein NUV78_00130 [Candidatus Zambryskibacteria bacterium]|nr:hypothetical protein [Candidatus Zambryskibacteria bacterium]
MKNGEIRFLAIFVLVLLSLVVLSFYLASNSQDGGLFSWFSSGDRPSLQPLSKCLVLEEQYCDNWVIIQDAKGRSFFAFNLPTGTKVLSPFGGYLMTGNILDWDWNDQTRWVMLEHNPSGNVGSDTIGFFAIGALSLEKIPQESLATIDPISGGSIDEGYIIAEIVDGPPIIDNYNLLIEFMDMDTTTKSLVYSEDLSKKYLTSE